MVVGAGAAFSDQSKIKNTEAVDACTALNIIGGYPDGSFKPEGNITRAEVTKMICVALNGGKNPAVSTNTTPTFSDVRNNANAAWAEGYIESCAAQGIVSGVGGGKFAPNGNVTGVQMAKMLLVSLGYKSENEGFTGNAWATNVNVRAAQKGLYDGLEKMDTNAALTRDNAAQMVWNALNAYEVEYKTTLVADSKGQLSSQITVQDKVVGSTNDKITLLEDKYEADTAIGTFAGNSDVTNCKDGNIQITNATINGATVKVGNTNKTDFQFKYDLDLKYLGEEVKVLYKDGDKSKVYGVFATDNNNVLAGNAEDLEKRTSTKVKFDGTEYDVAASTLVTVNGVKKADKTLAEYADVYKDTAATFSLVDNDDDDKYDVLTIVAPSVEKVTYSGSTSITAGKSYKYADENIADGIKKDDYVAIVDKAATKDGKYAITKAETVTGKIEAIKGTDVKVGGTWYKTADNADIEDNYSLNDEFTLAVVNGFVYHAEQGDEAISNDKVILATKVDAPEVTSGSIDEGTQKIKALFADGSEKQITVAQYNKFTSSAFAGYADMSASNKIVANKLYTFTTKSNGDYKLKDIDTSKYDGTLSNITKIDDGKAYDSSTPTASTMRFADAAAIFVVPGNGDDAKVITGKALGTWKNITALNSTSTTLYGKKDGGIVYANVGVVVMNSSTAAPSSGDVEYGFVTEKSSLVKDGDDYYISMTIWNGSSEIPVKADSYYTLVTTPSTAWSDKTDVDSDTPVSDIAAFAKQTPVSYKTTGDGLISEVRPLNVVENAGSDKYLGAVAVTGYKDGKKYVSLNGTDYDLTSDTVQMFVDTDAKTGETTGAITEANEVHGYFVKNAYAVVNSSNEVEFILVDTKNNLECNASEDDVKIVTKGGAVAAKADDETRVLKLNGATSIDVGNVFVANSTKNFGVQAVDAGKVFVVAANGTTKTSGNLAAGDTIRVIAQNGDVVDYSVVA